MSQPQGNPRRRTTPEERQAKKQTFIDLANKIQSSTTTTINTADLIRMLQPAIRVELRKCLFPIAQKNTNNDPMQEVNQAEMEPALETSASATTQCQIGNVTFTNAGIDSGASHPIMSSKVLSQLGLELSQEIGDKGNLSGIATSVKLLGWVSNVPVTISDITISDNFLVVEDSSPILILGNTWLKRAKGQIDYDKSELRISLQDREIAVPVSFHTKLRDGNVIKIEANRAQLLIQETKKNR
jgi:hypothetical protein